MEKLMDELKKKITFLKGKYSLDEGSIRNLYSIYPFNRFEYIMSHLLAEGILTIEDYGNLRQGYLQRNRYLHLYEITAPRTFWGTWAENHLNELVQQLQRPSKELDATYSGEYDFWYDGIRIEVKASRAVRRESGTALVEKALSSDSFRGFDMNFQQMKPDCCDVFVWIGVWTDVIRYWVLSSDEVKNNLKFSKGQHRGNKGEGQLWVKESNIGLFTQYLTPPRELLEKIKQKGMKSWKTKNF